MKKGVNLWVTFTLSLLSMTALTGISSQSIAVPQGPVQVKRGNDVTLWCKLENHSRNGVPVHWQTPPNFRTRTSNCDSFVKEKYFISCLESWYNMTIVDVQWDDRGKYRCVHTGHNGVVDLQVLVPVTDVSLNYLSSPGEHQNAEFKFICSTNCVNPAPTISWFENEKPQTFTVKTEEHKCRDDKDGLKQTVSTLTINVEQKKKLSKISCSAKDSFGVKKTSKAIDALTGTSSQSIAVQQGPVEVKQGNNITLWCRLKKNAESRAPVHWLLLSNFKTITSDCVSYMEKKYHISCAENGLRWYNLTIVDVQWKDKGVYRCISANGKNVDLRVLVPVTKVSLTHFPRSKKELLFLDKDNDAVLTCTTNCAYPEPSISWFENDKPFNGSAKVIITESGCTREKKGQKQTISTITVIGRYVGEERKRSNISCKARNIKGEPKVTRTVNVRYNALLTGARFQNTSTLLSGPVEVKQGNNISLWCKLIDDSVNEVPVHWQSPPKFMMRTSNCDTFVKQKYVMSCGSGSYNMTIINVQWTDKGKYRCVHTRPMGIVELQVLVPVSNVSLTHIPRSREKLLLLDKESDAVLSCTTNCAYPAPSISWFENNQTFNGSVEVTITDCKGEKKGQKRTISAVTVIGKYVGDERKQFNCTAGNVKGEPKVSRTVNVKCEIAKSPQHVMAAGGTAAAIAVPVFVIIVLIIIIVIRVHMYREKKKKKKVKTNSEELATLLSESRRKKLLEYVIYEYDDTSETNKDGIAFLEALLEGLKKHNFKVELREVNEGSNKSISKVVKAKSKKVILHFPKDKFDDEDQKELADTFQAIMQGGKLSFVAVIIQTEAYMALPEELQRIETLWIEKKRQTQGFGRAKYHLQFLQDEKIKPVDVALMNLGTGLAWSYYLGYLRYILSAFEETLLNSKWQKENPGIRIPENRLSKRLHIVFTTNCQKPKIMNSERIKLKDKIKHPIYRAGVPRDYSLEIQEVKSKNGKESYYGVVCFLSAVQCLLEMKDDPNIRFFRYDEDDMRTHGQDCFEKLRLIIKHNRKIQKDQLKFEFIKFNTEAANANENDLADDLFNQMKEMCSLKTRRPIQEAGTNAYETGILLDFFSKDVREFVDSFENSKIITDCPHLHGRIEFGSDIIRESKRVFMVLTDDFVTSDAFAKWFYMILDKGFEMNNKRFLVCLNCLDKNANHPKVLELEQLFDCVCYLEGWADKVRRELDGDPEEIRYDHLSHNIGTGLAMSWYYNFLKIKIPKVRDVIDQCPFLKEKLQEGRMSHKVFILFPSSCYCPEKAPCADIIEEVDSKEINLPQIKKDNRDYTPKVYKLNDDGKEYYAFVEYSAPADVMYRLKQEGFLNMPEKILQEEWQRFHTKLRTLIVHKDEPMDIKNRIYFIPYEDAKLKVQDIEFKLLDHVKEQLPPMTDLTERILPKCIDNGATIQSRY